MGNIVLLLCFGSWISIDVFGVGSISETEDLTSWVVYLYINRPGRRDFPAVACKKRRVAFDRDRKRMQEEVMLRFLVCQ